MDTKPEKQPSPPDGDRLTEDTSLLAGFVGAYALLQAARESIDAQERELISQAHDEGLSLRKMAQAIGVSHSTLRRRTDETARERDRDASRKTYNRLRSNTRN